MLRRTTYFVLACIGLGLGPARAEAPVWDHGNPVKGVNDENVDARIGEFTRMIDEAESDDERLRLYGLIIRDLESRVSKPESQHHVLGLVDKALALEPQGRAKIDILIHGASSVRKTLRNLHGADLRRERKRSATYQARAMREMIDTIETLERDLVRNERDFEARYPGFEKEMMTSSEAWQRAPWLAEMQANELQKLGGRYAIIEAQKQEIESLERVLERTPGAIAQLYSRIEPYDLEEVKTIMEEVVGDGPASEKVVGRTQGSISYVIAKDAAGAKFRYCALCFSHQILEFRNRTSAPESHRPNSELEEWTWEYSFTFKGKNVLTCPHQWVDGTLPRFLPEPVSSGQVVLVHKGGRYGAFVLTRQSREPRTAWFRWRSGTDATGGFDLGDPDVRGSDSPIEVTKRGRHTYLIKFAQFEIEWSSGPEVTGWIYYARDPGDTLTPYDLAICVTDAKSFDEIRPRDEKWTYRRSRVDGW